MKTLLLFSIAILFFLPFTGMAQNEYKCSEWKQFTSNDIKSKLFLRICENSNSGSLEIKNETNNDVKLTYLLNFNNGESTTGNVIINLDDKTSKIPCLNCMETIGSGIKSWEFREIIYKESDGLEKK